MKKLILDLDKCTGCRACELACSFVNTGYFNPEHSQIKVTRKDGDIAITVGSDCDCAQPLCEKYCAPGVIKVVNHG